MPYFANFENKHNFSQHAKIFSQRTQAFREKKNIKSQTGVTIEKDWQVFYGQCFFSRKKMQISIGRILLYTVLIMLCKSVEHMMDHCSTSQGVLATVSTLGQRTLWFCFCIETLYALLSKQHTNLKCTHFNNKQFFCYSFKVRNPLLHRPGHSHKRGNLH